MDKVVLMVILALLITGCGSDSGETPNPPVVGSVSGFTTDSNLGGVISGVTVSIDSDNVLSGNDGSYVLNNIPVGSLTITATKAGYQNHSGNVAVTDGNTTTSDIALIPIVEPDLVLSGTSWAQCYADVSGFFIIDTFVFVDDSIFKIITDEYEDIGCTGILASTNTTSGTYTLGEGTIKSTSGKDVTELDIILTDETAGSITPVSIFTIAYVDNAGTNLFLGITDDLVLDGSTADKRPLTLDSEPYIKQ